MGSSPILTETPPLSSSSGRVLKHKTHLVFLEGEAEKGFVVSPLKPETLRPRKRATPKCVRHCTLLGEDSAKYCEGGAKVAHLAHYQKTTFESFARNHIAGSSKGRTLDSLPSNLGSTPSRAPKVVHAYVNCEQALTRIL